MDKQEQRIMKGTTAIHETNKAIKVVIALHAAWDFTHAAATDGSTPSVPVLVHIGRLSDKVGLGPCLLKVPIVLCGRLALVSLFSPGEVSALLVHDYWSRQ